MPNVVDSVCKKKPFFSVQEKARAFCQPQIDSNAINVQRPRLQKYHDVVQNYLSVLSFCGSQRDIHGALKRCAVNV